MTNHTRKKVIIFITKSNWGGAQKYVFDIATNMDKEKFDIVVALGGKDLLYTKLVESGIKTIELESLQRDISFTKDFFVFANIVKIIKNERPNVIHVNSTKISGLGAVAGRMLGVKNIIFTVHGWAFNENRSFLSKLVIKFLYLVMLILSHNVIAVSHKITEQIKGWPFRKKKLTVVHNGIKTLAFYPRETAREELGKFVEHTFAPETILIGGIGELHPIKGHIYAIQAMEKIVQERPNLNIQYVIIGSGEIENELKKEIIDRKLLDKVFLTGYVKDGATYLKALDYYVFPSLSEGLPYAIVEAGFAELPVIASDVGGIPEVITANFEGKLIESQNPQAIVDALYAYIDHKDIAESHATALHKKTTKEFSIETMIARTEAIYLK